MAAPLVATALPTFADNIKVPGENGPLAISGNPNGAEVIHCAQFGELIGFPSPIEGTLVFNKNGISGTGLCTIA